MGGVGDECAWDKCLTFKCSQVLTKVVACGLQVNCAASGETPQCKAIFSQTKSCYVGCSTVDTKHYSF